MNKRKLLKNPNMIDDMDTVLYVITIIINLAFLVNFIAYVYHGSGGLWTAFWCYIFFAYIFNVPRPADTKK